MTWCCFVLPNIFTCDKGVPVRPVSSSMVKRHSRGGSLAEEGRSSKARAAATPMPLSAPRVVPSACAPTKHVFTDNMLSVF